MILVCNIMISEEKFESYAKFIGCLISYDSVMLFMCLTIFINMQARKLALIFPCILSEGRLVDKEILCFLLNLPEKFSRHRKIFPVHYDFCITMFVLS